MTLWRSKPRSRSISSSSRSYAARAGLLFPTFSLKSRIDLDLQLGGCGYGSEMAPQGKPARPFLFFTNFLPRHFVVDGLAWRDGLDVAHAPKRCGFPLGLGGLGLKRGRRGLARVSLGLGRQRQGRLRRLFPEN